MTIHKSDVQMTVNDRAVRAYLAAPDGGGPGMLVLHAWWGLNPFFQEVCDRLAGEGFVALAPDLHAGRIASTREEAQALMDRQDAQLTGETVKAALNALLANPDRKGKKIGVIGFSMGAAWTLVAADEAPTQVGTAVLFYGTYPKDFKNIQARVMGHFSDVDEWEPLENIQAQEKYLKAEGVKTEFHLYPGLRHWFMESDRPEYDPQAAGLAWERTLKFLGSSLK